MEAGLLPLIYFEWAPELDSAFGIEGDGSVFRDYADLKAQFTFYRGEAELPPGSLEEYMGYSDGQSCPMDPGLRRTRPLRGRCSPGHKGRSWFRLCWGSRRYYRPLGPLLGQLPPSLRSKSRHRVIRNVALNGGRNGRRWTGWISDGCHISSTWSCHFSGKIRCKDRRNRRQPPRAPDQFPGKLREPGIDDRPNQGVQQQRSHLSKLQPSWPYIRQYNE
jgi:hypothetical protein